MWKLRPKIIDWGFMVKKKLGLVGRLFFFWNSFLETHLQLKYLVNRATCIAIFASACSFCIVIGF